jgi:hypothetical protein
MGDRLGMLRAVGIFFLAKTEKLPITTNSNFQSGKIDKTDQEKSKVFIVRVSENVFTFRVSFHHFYRIYPSPHHFLGSLSKILVRSCTLGCQQHVVLDISIKNWGKVAKQLTATRNTYSVI